MFVVCGGVFLFLTVVRFVVFAGGVVECMVASGEKGVGKQQGWGWLAGCKGFRIKVDF